jgi:hypothetical protein
MPLAQKYHYMSKHDLLAELGKRFAGIANIRVHETAGHHGDMTCLTDADIIGGYTSEDDRDILPLASYIADPSVRVVIIPIHHLGWTLKNSKKVHYEPADHWDGYVLLREGEKMNALRLTTPGDGDCGGHLIHLVTELVENGVDAFREGVHASRLQSLSTEGLSGSIQEDAGKLVSIGVDLFPEVLLAPVLAVAKRTKQVTFGPNEERLFSKDQPAASVSATARQEAGFGPIAKETVTQAIAKQLASPTEDALRLTANALESANYVMQHFVLDKVFRKIVVYENLEVEKAWVAMQVPEDKMNYLAELAADSQQVDGLPRVLQSALQEARQEQKAYYDSTVRLRAPQRGAGSCTAEADAQEQQLLQAVSAH